jgi:hypothetical protein
VLSAGFVCGGSSPLMPVILRRNAAVLHHRMKPL